MWRIHPVVLLSIASLALALVAVISLGVLATRRASADGELARLLAVRDLIFDEYVEPVNGDDLARDAIRGMVEGLDNYSRYYPEERESKQVEVETTGRFGGIGVVLDPEISDAVEVLFPQPGSPAEQAGLLPGAQIIAIDGVPVERILDTELTDRIRGPEGTKVRITMHAPDDSKAREVEIKRTVMREPSVRQVHMLDPKRGIGGLWIGSFSEETPQQFDTAIEQLKSQGLKVLIMDLRFDGGGVLDSAAEIANRFIKSGDIYETRGRKNIKKYAAVAERATLAGMPVVILVNGETASASEVLTAALSDHGLAAVVGERTYGKGVVQALKRFEDNHAYVKITTAYYFTPSGRNLERPRKEDVNDTRAGGIAPDVEVRLSREERRVVINGLARFDVPAKYETDVARRRGMRQAPKSFFVDPQMEAALALVRGDRAPDRRL
ncbi:MAG: S41 family peptidase [Planctomycetes bacterium]|nr:S41 family peptidase [Planctomycetota bacterium]